VLKPVFRIRIREDPGYFQAMDPDPDPGFFPGSGSEGVKKEPKFGINI
jgi:hypothetical protein